MLKIIKETLIELIEIQKVTDKMTDKNRERIKLVIKYLSQNNSINNKEAQNLLDISESAAKRFLNKLVKENILEAVGEYKEIRGDNNELYKSTRRYREKKF